MKKITETAAIIIVLVALGLGAGKIYFRINKLKEQVTQITTAHNQLSHQNGNYQTLITRYQDTIQFTEQIILNQKQAIEMGMLREKELKDKYLREVQNVTSLSEEIQILKQYGRWVDTIYIEKISNKNFLEIPATMQFSDQWYKLEVTADHTPMLNLLMVYSEPTITIGTIRPGLLKKSKQVTIYENTNPYIKLKSMESLTIKEQKKWYQTTWFKVGAGFIIGTFTGSSVR